MPHFRTTINGMFMEVTYTYHKGEEEVHTESNGDPGTPGYPDTVTIDEVWTYLPDMSDNDIGVNIMDIIYNFEGDLIEALENEILIKAVFGLL